MYLSTSKLPYLCLLWVYLSVTLEKLLIVLFSLSLISFIWAFLFDSIRSYKSLIYYSTISLYSGVNLQLD